MFVVNISISGPEINATLSLYAEIKFLELDLEVDLIILNRLLSIFFPSIINFPLNILCLQCSELTCENPKTSLSVSFLFNLLLTFFK